MSDYFKSIQLGVDVSGSCESAIHATRRFMESMPNEFVNATFDYTNAFNNLRQGAMLKAAYKIVPEIYKFCRLSYSQPSKLRYGSRSISSEEGTLEGDPLGPLLFYITMQPTIRNACSSNENKKEGKKVLCLEFYCVSSSNDTINLVII